VSRPKDHKEWFVRDEHSTDSRGPFSSQEIQQLQESAGLWCWREGMSDWVPIASLNLESIAPASIPKTVGNQRKNKPTVDQSSEPLSHAPARQNPSRKPDLLLKIALGLFLAIAIGLFWNQRESSDRLIQKLQLSDQDRAWVNELLKTQSDQPNVFDFRLIERKTGSLQLLVVGEARSSLSRRISISVVPETALRDFDFKRVIELNSPHPLALVDLGLLDPGVYIVEDQKTNLKREFRVLGSSIEGAYEESLRKFHAELRATSKKEIKDLLQLSSIVQRLWESTQRAEVLVLHDRNAESRRGRWLVFHDQWSQQMHERLDQWGTLNRGSWQKAFHSEIYRRLFGVAQRLARYHEMQSVWLSGQTLSVSTEQLLRAEETKIRSQIQGLFRSLNQLRDSQSPQGFPTRQTTE
jgi:hypothetical protein